MENKDKPPVDKIAKVVHSNFQKIKEHLVKATPQKLTMRYTIGAKARIVHAKPTEEKDNGKDDKK